MAMKLNLQVRSFAIITALIFIASVTLNSVGAFAVSDSPAVIAAICPTFPPIARAAHVGGEIQVEVNINAEGEVTSAHATSGHPLLRKSAEKAAKRWQFTTSMESSSKRAAQLTFVFRVMPRCSKSEELTSVFSPPYKVEIRTEKPEIDCSDCSPAERQRLRCQNP
ncbi:MAG TPA: energy transducer TonB [Pyrinomonadaceae bacterium]|nr:energy transducer TonB [Pyrinomonadaceae bacterium]